MRYFGYSLSLCSNDRARFENENAPLLSNGFQWLSTNQNRKDTFRSFRKPFQSAVSFPFKRIDSLSISYPPWATKSRDANIIFESQFLCYLFIHEYRRTKHDLFFLIPSVLIRRSH